MPDQEKSTEEIAEGIVPIQMYEYMRSDVVKTVASALSSDRMETWNDAIEAVRKAIGHNECITIGGIGDSTCMALNALRQKVNDAQP